MKRILLWFLMVFALIGVAGIGLRSCAIARYENAIEEHMARARDRGEPTNREELGLSNDARQDDAAPLFRDAEEWLETEGRPDRDRAPDREWVERADGYYEIVRRAASKSFYRPKSPLPPGDTLYSALEAAQMVALRISASLAPNARDLDDIEMITRIAAYCDRIDTFSFMITATVREILAASVRTAVSKHGFDAAAHTPRLNAILDDQAAWQPMEQAALTLQVGLFETYRHNEVTGVIYRLVPRLLRLPRWARSAVNAVAERPVEVYEITRALDELESLRKRGIDVDTILAKYGPMTIVFHPGHPARGSFLTMLAWSVRGLRQQARLTRLGLGLLIEHQSGGAWPERLPAARPPLHYARRGDGGQLSSPYGKAWIYPNDAESARR